MCVDWPKDRPICATIFQLLCSRCKFYSVAGVVFYNAKLHSGMKTHTHEISITNRIQRHVIKMNDYYEEATVFDEIFFLFFPLCLYHILFHSRVCLLAYFQVISCCVNRCRYIRLNVCQKPCCTRNKTFMTLISVYSTTSTHTPDCWRINTCVVIDTNLCMNV